MPSSGQISVLLVSALQAHATLMRMSRVFPATGCNRLVDPGSVLSHSLSLRLAQQLRRCWRALGVTDSALRVILKIALRSAVDQTRALWPPQGLGHSEAEGHIQKAAQALQRLVEEGSSQSRPILKAEVSRAAYTGPSATYPTFVFSLSGSTLLSRPGQATKVRRRLNRPHGTVPFVRSRV